MDNPKIRHLCLHFVYLHLCWYVYLWPYLCMCMCLYLYLYYWQQQVASPNPHPPSCLHLHAIRFHWINTLQQAKIHSNTQIIPVFVFDEQNTPMSSLASNLFSMNKHAAASNNTQQYTDYSFKNSCICICFCWAKYPLVFTRLQFVFIESTTGRRPKQKIHSMLLFSTNTFLP